MSNEATMRKESGNEGNQVPVLEPVAGEGHRPLHWGEYPDLDITVNRISLNDLSLAIEQAFDDFSAELGKSMALGAFFVLGGLFFLVSLFTFRQYVLLEFHLFALAFFGPFFAAGFYEISHRRENGQKITSAHIIQAVFNSIKRGESYAAMGFVSITLFVIWMAVAALHYYLFMGPNLMNPSELVDTVTGTGHGWVFIMLGNLIGLSFLTLLFAISAFSFQLLYEHRSSVANAVSTSIEAVAKNPLPMLAWGMLISLAMLLSLATGFVPLIVIMPILGFTAWHLYRRTLIVATKTSEE